MKDEIITLFVQNPALFGDFCTQLLQGETVFGEVSLLPMLKQERSMRLCEKSSPVERIVKMKKKLFGFLLAMLLILSLCGCTKIREREVAYTNPIGGRFASIPNQDYLYYDINTKNVYIMYAENAVYYRGYGYMSAYYAPNGLPYLYDVNSQTLIENNGG